MRCTPLLQHIKEKYREKSLSMGRIFSHSTFAINSNNSIGSNILWYYLFNFAGVSISSDKDFPLFASVIQRFPPRSWMRLNINRRSLNQDLVKSFFDAITSYKLESDIVLNFDDCGLCDETIGYIFHSLERTWMPEKFGLRLTGNDDGVESRRWLLQLLNLQAFPEKGVILLEATYRHTSVAEKLIILHDMIREFGGRKTLRRLFRDSIEIRIIKMKIRSLMKQQKLNPKVAWLE